MLSTNASINKLIIAEMPACTVTQPLAGKSAQDIFSTDLFIQEIKSAAGRLHIQAASLEEKSLPLHLEYSLESDDAHVRAAAHDILKLFGERLARRGDRGCVYHSRFFRRFGRRHFGDLRKTRKLRRRSL